MSEDKSLLGRTVAVFTIIGVVIAGITFYLSTRPDPGVPQFPSSGEVSVAFENLVGDESPETQQLEALVDFLRTNEGRSVYLHVTLLNSIALNATDDPLHALFPGKYVVYYLAARDESGDPPECKEQGCPQNGVVVDKNHDGDSVGYVFHDSRLLLGLAIAVDRNDEFAEHIGTEEGNYRLKGYFCDVGEVALPAQVTALTVLPYMLRPVNGTDC